MKRIKNIKLNKKQQTYLILFSIFIMMLVLNFLTPLIADDFSYSFGVNNKRITRQQREILIGRTHNDFIEYTAKNPDLTIVEMDTVEGLYEESECLLTLYWRKSHFMLIFFLESQTTEEVTKVFEYLQQEITEDVYKSLFQVILTDNGHEFYDVLNIECNHRTGKQISKVFYCDPHESWQKGGIEKNHELIRYVLPKGTSFENLTQNDCYILANHINSLCRKSLNNKCPFKAMLFIAQNIKNLRFSHSVLVWKINCVFSLHFIVHLLI